MKQRELYIKVILFVICGILFTYHLGSALPIIESEKFYFQSVKEMFARHDWITPYYQGRFRFQKPILFYWLVSLSYLTFGINNFAVRFPSAVAGVLTVIFTFNIGRRLFDRKTGFLAAGILATSALFFMYARYASPDMVLTFLIVLSLYLFLKASKGTEAKNKFFIYFYAVLGLGVMNKGYVGLVLPLLVVLLYIVSTKKWRLLKSMNIPGGLLIVLSIGLPWYVIMYRLHGEHYLDHIMVRETLKRLFYAPNNESGLAFFVQYVSRLFFYVPIIAGWLLPYTIFLPVALVNMFKSKDTYSRERDSYTFILSFFFAIFMFFTLVSVKEYHYMLPIAPAFALIISRYLLNLQERGALFSSRGFTVPYRLLTVLSAAAIVCLLYTMRHLYPQQVMPYSYTVLLVPLVLIIPYRQRHAQRALSAIPVTVALIMLFLTGRAIPLLNDNAMRTLAERIAETIKEGDRVGVGSVNISQQRLGIYLDRHIEEVNVKWKSPEAVPENKRRIARFLDSGDDLYLVIARKDFIRYVDEERLEELTVVARKKTWKTRLKRSFSRQIILEILQGKTDLLKDVLRHEIVLVTNKKEG